MHLPPSDRPGVRVSMFPARMPFALRCLIALVALFGNAVLAQTGPPLDCTTGLPDGVSPGFPHAAPHTPHNTSNPGNEYFCTITTTIQKDGSEDIEIQQPVVDQPNFTYKPIVLRPGDQIAITADGCAQRAGFGQTWDRYVNPESPGPPFLTFNAAQQMYFGTITIPWATRPGTPGFSISALPLSRLLTNGVSNVINIPQLPTLADQLTPPTLTLGYTDDNWTDQGGNGYWNQDGGWNDTCKDNAQNFRDDPLTTHNFNQPPNNLYGGNAWVNLHIVHNVAVAAGQTVPLDFDIVSEFFDLNGFSRDPVWGWQLLTQDNPGTVTGPLPPASQAQVLRSDFAWPAALSSGPMPQTLMPFSSETPTIDTYHGGQSPVCNWQAWQVDEIETGHLNWQQATFDGIIDGGADHSQWSIGDDDLSILLDAGPSKILYGNPQLLNSPMTSASKTALEAEFTYVATLGVDDAPLSPFWATLNNAIPNAPFSGTGNTASVINGHRAIAIGLLGVDNVHAPTYAEIHPVEVLAIQENPASNQQADDKWAIMVRRQGNEGSCSDQIHDAGTGRFIIEFMPPPQFADPATGLPKQGVTATLISSDLTAETISKDQSLIFLVTQTVAPGGDQVQFFPANGTPGSQNGAVLVVTVADPSPFEEHFQGPGINPNLVMGEVELLWSGPQNPNSNCVGTICSSGSGDTANTTPDNGGEEPETTINKLWGGLTAAEQKDADDIFLELYPHPHAIALQKVIPTVLPTRPTAPVAPPKHTVIQDTEVSDRALAGLQAACVATQGSLGTATASTPFNGFCAGKPPVTSLTLIGAQGARQALPQSDIYGWLTAPVSALPVGHSVSGVPLQSTAMVIKPQAGAAQVFNFPATAIDAFRAQRARMRPVGRVISPPIPPVSPLPPPPVAPPAEPQPLSIGPNEILYASADTKGVSEVTKIRTINVAPKVSYIVANSATQGNWIGIYGADGSVVVDSHTSPPAYVLPAAKNSDDSIWDRDPAQDPRALYNNSAASRIAASWNSSTSFQVALPVTDQQHHKLSVYCVDWDSSARNQTLQLLDADSGAVLDSQTISNFHNGIWLSWTISGNVTLNVVNNAGANAVVSGLFFDPIPPDGTPPALQLTLPANGATYFGSSTAGASITPAFTASSAIGFISTALTIDGANATNGVPMTVSAGTHTYILNAVDKWGVQATTSGSFTVELHIRR